MKKILILFVVLCLFSSFNTRELSWIAIGDSITYLNDHLDETGNRVSKGYLTQTVEHFPGLHYINKGYNGWTAAGIARHIDSLGLVKADVYSIFLGTNDWWQGRPIGVIDDYKSNKGNNSLYGSFRIIIDKIHHLNPHARILLITPMRRVDFVYVMDARNNAYGSYKPKNDQFLEAFANAIDTIGAYEKIPVIDLYHNDKLKEKKLMNFKRLKEPVSGQYKNYRYPESVDIPYNPIADEYPYPKEAINLTYDGLHPSDKGNKIIANCIVKIFKKLF